MRITLHCIHRIRAYNWMTNYLGTIDTKGTHKEKKKLIPTQFRTANSNNEWQMKEIFYVDRWQNCINILDEFVEMVHQMVDYHTVCDTEHSNIWSIINLTQDRFALLLPLYWFGQTTNTFVVVSVQFCMTGVVKRQTVYCYCRGCGHLI